jgi:hypothetical protein
MDMHEELFATLYAFCGAMKQPVDPHVADAFNQFVRAFGWACPALVHAEEDWGRQICLPHHECPFEAVATIHEFTTPHTFNGAELVQKYLVKGVSKDEWGRRLWTLLHKSADHFTPEQLDAVLNALAVLLPCPQCRQHLAQTLQVFRPPPKCCPRQFLCDLHNIVNMRLQKPIVGKMTPYARQIAQFLNEPSS